MKSDALGRENPCPVCWKQDPDRPMCFKGEPWCSDQCRKVVQGEVAPNQKQLTLMPQWLLDQLGIASRVSDTAIVTEYDADDDEHYPVNGSGQ